MLVELGGKSRLIKIVFLKVVVKFRVLKYCLIIFKNGLIENGIDVMSLG